VAAVKQFSPIKQQVIFEIMMQYDTLKIDRTLQYNGGNDMPFYDLKCSCGEVFNVMASMSDKENKRIKCPKCGSNELETVFSNINIIQSKKSNASECPNFDRCGGCCH
jgi:putative FmdB family regulatory protein